ncbi:Ubiquinone/menaquinone biosynthesis C-methyltransferase UbiE [uncultured archaeon]|nr:Ubiquinone/menaquinone biosynthesis C-methyltransferase UbiE [uncultured archaeon]
MKNPKRKEIQKLNVSELVSLTDEVNKPPGGMRSLLKLMAYTFMSKRTKVLEIGCNTGYSSIEMKRHSNADVYGIDINVESIKKAINRSRKMGLKVKFITADATNLPFKENMFDVVFCSNVTSFLKDKKAALENYVCVLKPYGFLVAIPIYYLKNPPKHILKEVSTEIGTEIKPLKKQDWLNIFNIQNLELCYSEDFTFKFNKDYEIKKYITNYYLSKNSVSKFSAETKRAIYEKYLNQFRLFNKNLSYTGASILIYRKLPNDYEKELFPFNA